jgi:hypothetical protein
MSTISTSTTTNTGYVVTSDTTGALVIQTGATPTTALTISSAQVVTLANSLPESSGGTGTSTGYYGFKNRIINGAQVIDQRNAGASVTPTTTGYLIDRWQTACNIASKASFDQTSTAPTGFTNSMLITSLSAYSVAAGDILTYRQQIEGFNIADLGWGTASAATVTVSFWVRSSLTGTFGGSVKNGSSARSYPFTYTISTADTWEYETITIAGDTTGTWPTDNTSGLILSFGLGVGSTTSGTAGAWATANYNSATGATSVVGTNGATFYVTGVQLEKGSTATSFDYRPYGTELVLCQRYYTSLPSQGGFFGAHAFSTNRVISSAFYPATMRATPTVTSTAIAYTYFINGAANTSSASVTTANLYGNLIIDITANATSGTNGVVSLNSTIALSAEL